MVLLGGVVGLAGYRTVQVQAQADAIGRSGSPALDAITAVTLHDYQQLRFADQALPVDTQEDSAALDALQRLASIGAALPAQLPPSADQLEPLFFALYASLNSYHELHVQSTQGELYKWTPRMGQQPLL